jgi:RNA polymerase-binding transcription factor DksA/uncharacterized protein YndB with AHSA1/START domain
MPKRVDEVSRLIPAPASRIFAAFDRAEAMIEWLPPAGMTGQMLAFDFREGGVIRLRLNYNEPQHTPGKTSEHADEVEIQIVRLVPAERIEQTANFESDDPAFSGTMRIVWTFEPDSGGTLVTVRCENVPAGVSVDDHQAALTSTLDNLAAFSETGSGRYKDALLREKAVLIELVSATEESSRPVALDQSSVGRLSRMDAMQMQHMALETGRRRESRLQKINGALLRIEEQRFGFCFVCGNAIGFARLDLDPATTRCVNCVDVES